MKDDLGWMRTTFLVPCDLSDIRPDKTWITSLLRQNPDFTGWPFFVDLWTPRNPEYRPKIKDGIWEAKIVRSDDDFDEIDHWKIDAKRGLFYAARALEDDTSPRSPNPSKTLDFGLAILRTAEILAIAVQFSNYLCEDKNAAKGKIKLTIRWTGLEGRNLSSWANPGRSLSESYVSSTDVISKSVYVPIKSGHDQLVLFTKEIIEDLFLSFDGWVCPDSEIEDLVGRLFNRTI